MLNSRGREWVQRSYLKFLECVAYWSPAMGRSVSSDSNLVYLRFVTLELLTFAKLKTNIKTEKYQLKTLIKAYSFVLSYNNFQTFKMIFFLLVSMVI